jgi:hypothetical protein
MMESPIMVRTIASKQSAGNLHWESFIFALSPKDFSTNDGPWLDARSWFHLYVTRLWNKNIVLTIWKTFAYKKAVPCVPRTTFVLGTVLSHLVNSSIKALSYINFEYFEIFMRKLLIPSRKFLHSGSKMKPDACYDLTEGTLVLLNSLVIYT